MSEKIVDEHHFINVPFTDVHKYIMIDNDFGVRHQLKIRSHDLAIKVPKKAIDSEIIQDGGCLRPLTVFEQEQLLIALRNSSREYQLMFYFALFTGARLQTVCTLRMRHFDEMKVDSFGFVKIPVGSGTDVDTKYKKNMMLLVPEWLAKDIKIYMKSDMAKIRRERSFYGDTAENYIFLTKFGTPFYTSQLEINERKQLIILKNMSVNSFVTYDGSAIRSYIKLVLLPRIRLNNTKYQSFSFHDLRATFGMNLLEAQLNNLPKDYPKIAAVEYVQARMGHTSKETTLQYLNYKSRLEWKKTVQTEFETTLMKYIASDYIGSE